jgi:hypothetical protein
MTLSNEVVAKFKDLLIKVVKMYEEKLSIESMEADGLSPDFSELAQSRSRMKDGMMITGEKHLDLLIRALDDHHRRLTEMLVEIRLRQTCPEARTQRRKIESAIKEELTKIARLRQELNAWPLAENLQRVDRPDFIG